MEYRKKTELLVIKMNGKQRLLAFTIFGIYFLIATLIYFFFFLDLETRVAVAFKGFLLVFLNFSL